jgi:hypothetical protein
LGEVLLRYANGKGGNNSDRESGAMTKKARSKRGELLERAAKRAKRNENVQLQALLAKTETAAYKQLKRRTRIAWKASEFDQALHLSRVLKTIDPLAEFLESNAPLTKNNRLTLITLIRPYISSLESRGPGRPKGRSQGDFSEAERNAAYWVRLEKQKWLKNNGRQKVPRSVTNALIKEAIKLASMSFPAKLSPDGIRGRLDKTSRK